MVGLVLPLISMRAFILAGGFATRLWPLTEKRAKPLLPLAGKPIISHLIEKIPTNMPVTVSTNAVFAERFKWWMDDLGRPKVELVIEGTRRDAHKLGALGSIAEWVKVEKIKDDLLILTGDNYLGFSLDRFLGAFRGVPLLAAHDVGDLERAKAFGTVILDRTQSQRVVGFEEKPKDPKSTLVSTGCVILPTSTLPVLLELARVKPDNLGGIFEEFLRRGIEVGCFAFPERWMDIGSFQSYLDAHRELVGEHALMEPSAHVQRSTLRGSVTVGRNCVIENSELSDCMIFDDVHIRDCTLRQCIIDECSSLQGIDLRKQMLRAGTRLVVQ